MLREASDEMLRRRILFKILFYSLFQKNLKPASDDNKDAAKENETIDISGRIRCPLCRWQPRAESLWFCADAVFPELYAGGCGTAWNTFATGGVCPGCDYRWRWTVCLACHKNSRHADWYVGGEKPA